MQDQNYETLKAENSLLAERVARIEEKIYGGQKENPITLNQQILLLKYLGLLTPLLKLNTSNVKKAELVGLLLNRDMSNVKKAIENLMKSDGKELKTKKNLLYVWEVVKQAKLKNHLRFVAEDLMISGTLTDEETISIVEYLE